MIHPQISQVKLMWGGQGPTVNRSWLAFLGWTLLAWMPWRVRMRYKMRVSCGMSFRESWGMYRRGWIPWRYRRGGSRTFVIREEVAHCGDPCWTCGFRTEVDRLNREFEGGEKRHRLRLESRDGRRFTVWADQHGRVERCWWPLPLLVMRFDVNERELGRWVDHRYVMRLDVVRTLREEP